MRRVHAGCDLVEAARAESLDVRVLELDVTEDASVERAIAQVLDAEGRIDVLVNNAGVMHFGSVELLPDERMRSTFETNLFGPVRMLRAVLPIMRSQGFGVIVNVSSVSGRVPAPPISWSYTATKHGLSVLSDALAMELAPHGIRVISIEPGFFQTNIVAKAPPSPGCDSPYRALEDAVVAFYAGGVDGGADAQAVADAVVEAVVSDDGCIHVLVGKDAQFFVSQSKSLTEAEMISFYEELIGISTPLAAKA
jgi:NAD(P)-dependent dehydrogenase (short-subunit alcohol dehydrogenase family)